MTRPLIVLDLDGTLVDTAEDLIATLNRILADAGVRPMTRADAGALLGAGAKAMIQRGFSIAEVPLAEDELDRLFARFIPLYGESIAVHSRPFPGMEAALDRFVAAGWDLAVCTNKLEGLSLQLLDALGLTHRFSAICGGDTFAWRKPDGRHILSTIERAGGDPKRAVMVGDSGNDILAARAAGVPVVAFTFGYTDKPVADYHPDAVLDRFDQLFDAVAKFGIA